MNMDIAFAIILIFSLSTSVFWLTKSALRKQEAVQNRQKEVLQVSQEKYFKALEYLEKNPIDPKARIHALETGREFYSLAMPNTYTTHFQGTHFAGTSNHQNNGVSREARINSDIEARIGHLKIQRTA